MSFATLVFAELDQTGVSLLFFFCSVLKMKPLKLPLIRVKPRRSCFLKFFMGESFKFKSPEVPLYVNSFI